MISYWYINIYTLQPEKKNGPLYTEIMVSLATNQRCCTFYQGRSKCTLVKNLWPHEIWNGLSWLVKSFSQLLMVMLIVVWLRDWSWWLVKNLMNWFWLMMIRTRPLLFDVVVGVEFTLGFVHSSNIKMTDGTLFSIQVKIILHIFKMLAELNVKLWIKMPSRVRSHVLICLLRW